jgi:V/A-type H+-transporting ATPase subunit I
MTLRPSHARWFEVLTTAEDLTLALETLAATSQVELETHSNTNPEVSLQNLQERMQTFNMLARRYQPYWPDTDLRPATMTGKPSRVLDTALQHLLDWEQAALPLIHKVERLNSEQAELGLLHAFLTHLPNDEFELGLLVNTGNTLTASLFALPHGSRVSRVPDTLLVSRFNTGVHDFLLAVGIDDDLDMLSNELMACKAEVIHIPRTLKGNRPVARRQIEQQQLENDLLLQQLHRQIGALSKPHRLHETLGDIYRLEWFLNNVSSLPVSRNFAWVTGWTSDRSGHQLRNALNDSGVDAVIHYPPAPGELTAPQVMVNPWWAKPFELFASMLGTPSHNEVDPSRLLAFLVPLLFGYMFADVGQGLVLFIAGLLLQKRWPILRILVANGFSAMLFGFVFGSVFGREDIIPALWVHPVTQPLPVLMVPLFAGVLIILTGLLLNAAGAYWRGQARHWLLTDAAVLAIYVSILASLFTPYASMTAVLALAWYFGGTLLVAAGQSPGRALLPAAGELVETLLQLLVNTVSFVRVGAFALAHGGLSMAFNIMADATNSLFASFLLLVLGNLIVMALEGLVVTIQTTRLVLFEFFIRFLQGTGRAFRPLTAPAIEAGIRRTT